MWVWVAAASTTHTYTVTHICYLLYAGKVIKGNVKKELGFVVYLSHTYLNAP